MAYMYESFDGSHISVRSIILTTVHVYKGARQNYLCKFILSF
jgi:hypothetical protein